MVTWKRSGQALPVVPWGAAEVMMATYACGIPVMIVTHVNDGPFIQDWKKIVPFPLIKDMYIRKSILAINEFYMEM